MSATRPSPLRAIASARFAIPPAMPSEYVIEPLYAAVPVARIDEPVGAESSGTGERLPDATRRDAVDRADDVGAGHRAGGDAELRERVRRAGVVSRS